MNIEDVTGVTYGNAETSMALIAQNIEQRQMVGFKDFQECSIFASENNLDLLAYSPSSKGFYHVNHKGELLHEKEWGRMYWNCLYTTVKDEKKETKKCWLPDPYKSRDQALIVGEHGNGIRQPLYERNYFVPTGYRNPSTGCFNTATPFPNFAVETGADTSFIYELLQHIAGENYPYLLSWLRRKMLYPTQRTEVVPIFTGIQGTGKSSFGEVICKAMFGQRNVLVTPFFDGTSRFNSDQSDVLVISIEEKQQNDNKNTTSLLKSLSTITEIRKENKGVDPFYQDNMTEYVLTTNEVVPVKFDSRKQRRFMVMEADREFVRKKAGERETDTSILADEVFTKLYGNNKNGEQVGLPLKDNKSAIEQFKYELMENRNLPNCRDFLETEAFQKCFEIPRTVEMIEIEAMIKAIVPFASESLKARSWLPKINLDGEIVDISSVTEFVDGLVFIASRSGFPDRVGINRMLLFRNDRDVPYSHASVDKCLHDMTDWLNKEYGMRVLGTIDPPHNGGFKLCSARYRNSPTLWFALNDELPLNLFPKIQAIKKDSVVESQYRVRYNDKFQPDQNGCFEVLNPLKPATERNSDNVTSQAWFLLEADEVSKDIQEIEAARLQQMDEWDAEELYKERLTVQKSEASRLFRAGIVQRIVYSGAKSIHMIVQVKDAPKTKEERRWLDAYLKTTLSNRLIFDFTTSDPARLTRSPNECRRETKKEGKTIVGRQRLIDSKPENIYDLNWRPLFNQWLNNRRAAYEISLRKMLPTKAIYKDAAIALMDGTFWSNSKWNGQRNSVFFAAYRLIRAMGHTADEFWAGLKDDIKGYYKPEDIGYWLSRRDGSLIQEIEREIGE